MSQYPLNASVKAAALTDTPAQVLFAVGSLNTDIRAIHLTGGAAAEIVIFRAVDDTPEYFRVKLGIAEDKWIVFAAEHPLRIANTEGLEVATASAATDVDVEVYFWKPGAAGIGV